MKTLLLLAAAAAAAWWYYQRQHPQAAPAPAVQAADNAATRYADSLKNDEAKAAETAQKMNAAIGQTEKALGEATKQ